MPAYYLEPSAMFKRYRREQGSEVVNELFEKRTPDEHFATSYLSALEVRTVAARMQRGRLLRPSQYRRLLAQFATDLARVHLLPLEDTVVDEALDLIPDHALRAPDALHFATALRVLGTAGTGEFYLVSADREIGEAARRYPVQVIDPEDAGAMDQLHTIRQSAVQSDVRDRHGS
jgi:predicted nucleic acid-binding protein